MNKIVEQCQEIAKTYPYSSGEIFGLYNLIGDCRKEAGFDGFNEDKQFETLIRVLDFCASSACNPAPIISLIYSTKVQR